MLAAAAAARGASDAAARRAAADSVAAHADALPSPPAAAHADAPTASLGLGDWMNLAYTVSTMYKRVHPEARAASGEARRAAAFAEPAVLASLVAFITVASVLALYVLMAGVTCRPVGVDALAYSLNTPAANFYASEYLNRVCEAQIKGEGDGFVALAIVLTLLAVGAVSVNQSQLDRLNRLHAIARGDIYSPALGKAPVEAHETAALFERCARAHIAAKAVLTAAGVAGFSYFVNLVESRSVVTRDAGGVLGGGSLLTRSGAPCDGARMRYDDRFSGALRCHIGGETAVVFLRVAVYVLGCALMLVLIGYLVALTLWFRNYTRWRARFDEHTRARAAARAAAGGGGGGGDGAPPGGAAAAASSREMTERDASLVRALRAALRVAIGYFAAEPPEGIPELLSQIIVGKAPTRDELGSLLGRLIKSDRPVPDEVASLLFAVMQAALGRGLGEPGEVRELLMAAVSAWSDAAQQSYLRGMLDVLRQQNRARRQEGAVGAGGGGGGGGGGGAGGRAG